MMTVHKLSGGDGYAYLTRQTAVGDRALDKGQTMVDYYTESGEPPGIWAGRGIDALGVSGTVRERQMQALFGEGLHPDADTLGPIQLGQAPRKYANDTAFSREYRAMVTAFRQAHGRGVTADEHAALRAHVAARLLAEQDPSAARNPYRVQEFLGEQRRSERQPVAGFDLVFSPAKSISTLWAVGSPEMRAAVEAAHEEAWRGTLDYLEREAAFTRTGHNGTAQVETRGLVVTAFDHRTSRAGDPDLHTHMVVANRVQGLDGKWRALDARVLYSLGVSASEMYNSRVEDAVSRRLGVSFHAVQRPDGKRPVREIVGIPAELTAAFSKRRGLIEPRYAELLRQYRAAHGWDPSRPAQVQLLQQATIETREAKGKGAPMAQHVAQWRAEAERVLGADGLERMLTDVATAAPTHDARTLDEVARDVLGVVSEERSTWNRWHVRAESERQLRAHPAGTAAYRDAVVDQVEAKVLGPGSSIRLTMETPGTLPPELQRATGESVFRVHGTEVYTSQAVLDAESRLVAAGREPTAYMAAVAPELLEGLTPGQAELVRHFAGSGMQLAVGVGAAGVGKSYAMARLVTAWEATGARVIGLAPNAAAAAELGRAIGAQADTIDSLLVRHANGFLPAEALRAGDMLLVDEAATARTRLLDRLRGIAEERGAVIRLVGDFRQTDAVGAGGVFRLLAQELGASEMLDVLRFDDAEEAAASLRLRAGDQDVASWYAQHGRLHEGTGTDMLERAYRAWSADRDAGLPTIMMADSNTMVRELNERAHLDLVSAGVVTGPTTALREGQAAAVGDVVLARRNDRRNPVSTRGDFVRNGDLLTVTGIGADGSLTVQRIGSNAVTTLDAEYVRTWVDLGYATTVNRAQGITVKTSHTVPGGSTTREALYTAMTRAAAENHVYIPVEEHLGVDLERAPDARGVGEEVFRRIVTREGAERSATETVREELAAPERLDRLVPEYVHAVQMMSAEQQDAKREVLAGIFGQPTADAVLAEDAAPALLAEMDRHEDIAAAMSTAAAERELDTAESVAQVLQWRLERLRSADAARALAGPLPWLPQVPDTAGEMHDWAVERAGVIEDRAAELAAQVDSERPAWARPLGDRPVEPEPARVWDRAAALAAAYREQWQVTDDSTVLGRERPTQGTRGEAWTAADAAVRQACPLRPFATMPDRQLAQMVQTLLSRQLAAQRWQEQERDRDVTRPGPNTRVAEREVAELRDQAAQARAAAAAEALHAEVVRAAAAVQAKELERAEATGMFAGGRRKAITAEIEQLRGAHQAKTAEHAAAAARAPQGPPGRFRGDPSERAVEKRAEQILAAARQRDEQSARTSQRHGEAAVEAVRRDAGTLQEAMDEQAYRQEQGITVEEPPEAAAQRVTAAHAAIEDDYLPEMAPAVEIDGMEL